MRLINKEISLEAYKSRLPGIVPAISGDVFVEFDGTIEERLGYGNYGLIPSDMTIPDDIASKITDYTDIYVNIRKDGDEYDYYNLEDRLVSADDSDSYIDDRKININGDTRIVMTYQTIMKWYRFMCDYMELLHYKQCRTFSSATEFYDTIVVGNPNYDETPPYGFDRESYEELDRLYEARGGDGFYDWVTNAIIPKFTIPSEYQSAWGTTYLYYPDAMMWHGWLLDRYSKYEWITDCRDSEDCCECNRYKELGGADMCNKIGAWCEGVRSTIEDTVSRSNMEASVNIPIMLTRGIDNLGNVRPLMDDWYPKRNYDLTIDDGEIGTVVKYDDETYAIKRGNSGYYINEYKEAEFNYDAWVDYTKKYVDDNPDKFVPITTYTYTPSGLIVHDPTDEKMSHLVNYTKREMLLYGNGIYDVINGYYVVYNGGEEYLNNGEILNVEWESDDLPYVIVSRKKFYGFRFLDGYAFNFKGKSIRSKDMSIMMLGKFVKIGGNLFMVKDGTVTINNSDSTEIYQVLDGFFEVDDYTTYYIKGDNVYTTYYLDFVDDSGDTLEQVFDTVFDDDVDHVVVLQDTSQLRIYDKYVVYEAKIITGYTSNKITNVRDEYVSTDELGNELPGYFIKKRDDNPDNGHIYMQPVEGEMLDIPYHIGNVTNVGHVEDETHDYYYGNIIREMDFYYKTYDGERYSGSSVTYYIDGTTGDLVAVDASGNTLSNADFSSSLWAIDKLSEDTVDDTVDNDHVYCDMTYHLNAVLSGITDDTTEKAYKYVTNVSSLNGESYNENTIRVKSTGSTGITIGITTEKCEVRSYDMRNFFVPMDSDGEYIYHPGIVYKDTMDMTVGEVFYCLNEEENYPVNYYVIDVNGYDYDKMNEMNDSLTTSHSYFETPILIYSESDGEVVTNEYFEGYNGMAAFPVFRMEHDIGSASIESVDNDIYVDRGRTAAIDRHLRLGEVKTLEALASYSNGMFKIINDKE